VDGSSDGYLKAVCDYEEELDALGWAAPDLQGRRKSDPQKV